MKKIYTDLHGIEIFEDAESIKKLIDDTYEPKQYNKHLEAQLDLYLTEYTALFKENGGIVLPEDVLLESISNEESLLQKANYELDLIKDLVKDDKSIETIKAFLSYTVFLPQKNLAQALMTVSGEQQREDLNFSIRSLNSTYSKIHRLKQNTIEVIQNIIKHQSHIKALKYYLNNREHVEEELSKELAKEPKKDQKDG